MPDIPRIKARLAYLGITQEKLALAMGLERSALTRYLREVRPWPEGMAARIYETLDHIEDEQRVAAEAVQKLRAERAALEARERRQ